MFFVPHVNKVIDYYPAKISKTKLPGNLSGSLHVHTKSGILCVAFRSKIPTININCNQGLGLLNDNRPTHRQGYFLHLNLCDFFFNCIMMEQRPFVIVKFNPVCESGHYKLQEFLRMLKCCFFINDNFIDITSKCVAYGTGNHIAFFVNTSRAFNLDNTLRNNLPKPGKISKIPLKFGFISIYTRSTNDKPNTFRWL